MLLADVAAASAQVAGTSKRSGKVAALAECLRRATPDEVPVVVAYLSGELRQRRTGVGWASLRDVPVAVAAASLAVLDVDATMERLAAVAGAGAQRSRAEIVRSVMARATAAEQALLRGLIIGELRQGALEGVMLDAVAQASGLPAADVRRAAMLSGSLGAVAAAALARGAAGLAEFRLQVGRPLQPMLASAAPDIATAWERLGRSALDWKLDGIRVQIHRDGSDVAVFSRSLDEITARVPEVVEAALRLPAGAVVLDGEVIALRPDGRPRPFQQTGSRVSSQADVTAARRTAPLSTYVFDVLYVEGRDLLDDAAADRFRAMRDVVPEELHVPRVEVGDLAQAREFVADTLARGHEGVVAKSLTSTYEAGRRGAAWLKVKPRHTLDLVVLAAEWGHGRRQGWLSNLHLGARDAESGGFVMLGKTFKGLTDSMLAWQTERLQELAVDRSDWVVHVSPELVVEVAFDGVQTSPRYPAGMALRFARVLRHRPDKSPSEADTVQAVREIHARGGA